ncbi:MAG: nucleoside hydrolase [Bacteroidota bacterium]
MKKFYSIVFLFSLLLVSFQKETLAQTAPIPVILDADTGNEVDDLYAVARALIEPSWNILALNATHWQTSHWAIPQTMENSYRLNQVLVGEMGVDVKTRRGGIARMFDWGDLAQHSAAAYEIIQQTKTLPDGEQLAVVALGALTNVASAIYIDPTIESKLKLYWLGSTYDFDKEIFKRQDFNCVMDVQALEILLNSTVEMHIIPVNIAAQMTFDRAEVNEKLKGQHTLGDFLSDRWFQHLDGSRRRRVIWDLALIQAVIYPDWATEVEVKLSKENGDRTVFFYKDIQAESMRQEFYEKIAQHFEK